MGDLPGGDGAAEMRSETSQLTSGPEPIVVEIGKENRAIAERAAREIIQKIQPNSVSEKSRRGVINYIQRLTRNRIGVEVFPYGSVPLKTYLPHGDIDLTVFGGTNAVDNLADGIKSVLEEEEKAMTPEFIVKDVQLVHAEVKIVKCIVEDIVIDVSFNQIGGLCTLCFLEQIDRLIGKDHLFKQSIILIKAWCYYESRVLGAHHGLISTYALEILVLYIFNLFNSKLDGPLTVLYKFLDYFSKFDWENYCISIKGPARLSLLPDIVAEIPGDSDGDLLLPNDFLSSCIGMFSVPSTAGEKNALGFPRKHLNIVDPLKEQNNLGRSVSKGNFYRICSAFSYGAKKLSRIFVQPEHSIVDELHKFFSNTMTRHRDGKRPDVRAFDTLLISSRYISPVLRPDQANISSESFDESAISTREIQSISCELAQDLQKGMEIESHIAGRNLSSRSIAPGPSCSGDQNNLAASGPGALSASIDSLRCQDTVKETASPVRVPLFAPRLCFSKSKLHGSFKDEIADSDLSDKLANNDERRVSITGSLEKIPLAPKDSLVALSNPKKSLLASSSSFFPGHLNRIELDKDSAIRNDTPESLSSFDLSGDYETNLRCLRYGRWCIEYSLGMHYRPFGPYQKNNTWCGLSHSHFESMGIPPIHQNVFHPSTSVYGMQPLLATDFMYGWEEGPKPRGLGTYFPNPVPDTVALSKRMYQAPFQDPYPSGSPIPADGTIELNMSSHAAATFLPDKSPRKAYPSSPRIVPKMARSYSAFRKEQGR